MLKLTRPEGTEARDLDVSRRALGGLFFAGYAAAAVSASAAPIVTDLDGLIAETALIPSGGIQVPAYVARPAAKGKYCAILVVSEVFGVHEYIRDVCRRLAKLGFVAIAPDLFSRHGDPAPLTDFAAIRKIVGAATDDEVLGDINATALWLKAQPFVNGKLGITGFCWGGAAVWLACERFKHFRAGVAWYGRLSRPADGQFLAGPERSWPLELVQDLKVPVLGLYAGKDQGIPLSDVDTMNFRLLQSRKTGSLIVVYPDAQHGFHADYRTSYDLDAAQDGWRRMIDFFEDRGVKGKAI